MNLLIQGQLLDFSMDFLKEATELIDKYLENLDERKENCPDPDSFGLYDDGEHITGLGFVVCQYYITAIYSFYKKNKYYKENKPVALRRGPKHCTGLPFAELINACANYWKHHEEWRGVPKEQLRPDSVKTIKAMKSLGIKVADGYYPLHNAFCKLLGSPPYRFNALLPLLKEWRESVRQAAKEAKGS